MKYLITLIISLLSFTSFSQDTIVRRDGQINIAIVKVINELEIKYIQFQNPDGLVRTVLRSEISEVRYSDGVIEKFYRPKKTNSASNSNSSKLIIGSSSCFVLDFTNAYAYVERARGYGSDDIYQAVWGATGLSKVEHHAYHFDVSFGYKLILKEKKRAQFGLQFTILRLGLNKAHDYFAGTIGIGHLGTINSFSSKKTDWVYEIGANVGLQYIGTLGYHQKLVPTGVVAITSIWRKNRFGLGFEISYSAGKRLVKDNLYKEKMIMGGLKLDFNL